MTDTRRTARTRVGAVAALIALGVIGAPLRAMEEVTVYGVAQQAARDAHFRSEMALYVKTVELGFKAEIEFDLKQSVEPPLMLAGSFADNRG